MQAAKKKKEEKNLNFCTVFDAIKCGKILGWFLPLCLQIKLSSET